MKNKDKKTLTVLGAEILKNAAKYLITTPRERRNWGDGILYVSTKSVPPAVMTYVIESYKEEN